MKKLTTLFILAITIMFFVTGCTTARPQATNADVIRAINNLADTIEKDREERKEVTPEIPATRKHIKSTVEVDSVTNESSEEYVEEEIAEDDAAVVAETDKVTNESDGVLTTEEIENDQDNASGKKAKQVVKKKKVKKVTLEDLAKRVSRIENNEWRQNKQIANNREALNKIGWFLGNKEIKTVAVGYFRVSSSKDVKGNIKKNVIKLAKSYKAEIEKRMEDGHYYSVELKLIGFADTDGDEEENIKLSVERAKTVQALFIEALEAQGISGKIEIAGEGETDKWFTKDNARCVVIENTFVQGDLIEVATAVEDENENEDE